MHLADEIEEYTKIAGNNHGCGSLPLRTLLRIEQLIKPPIMASAETGCGKSTIFLSRLSKTHKVFCLDDRGEGDGSSVEYFMKCPATSSENLEIIYGPTQLTLPKYEDHTPYDLVLIDGPHGYPFPDLEYYYFYPHLRIGGLLIVDDIHIPTIGRLADFISEDAMFELVEFIDTTAIFRRTDAPAFDPTGDGWWRQDYNRRRAPFSHEFYLADGKRRKPISFEHKYKWRTLFENNQLLNRLATKLFIKRLNWAEVISARSSAPITGSELKFQRKLLKIIQTSQYFDEMFYLDRNPQIKNSAWNPAFHYLLQGGFEGRDPGPNFSTENYLKNNPDAAASGLNALLHYEIQRQKEEKVLDFIVGGLFSKN
jgi:predicted O-methyltransferase YrrM